MALTLEQVRTAFQNAIPRRRDEFEAKVRNRFLAAAHESQYPLRYPTQVLEMAEVEVRERAAMAAERVRQLLDSGWKPPNQSAVQAAFGAMYSGFDTWQKDPSSDLYAAVRKAFSDVGRNDPAQVTINERRLGEVQVQSSNEMVSDLEVYGDRFIDSSSAGSIAASPVEIAEAIAQTPWQYDAFICHASEDKLSIADELAASLTNAGARVWYDEFELRVGDGLRERIDDGLRSSRYGIVILSPAFFGKVWPKTELEGLLARQSTSNTKVVLPIWHNLTAEEVAAVSPILAGRVAAKTADGIAAVVRDLLAVIRPAGS